ncbi:MAG: PHP domain-containing protein [Acidimicrobiales bacterium]
MGPVEVLERIAWLCEREQEPTYRVRAFRGAAAALTALGPAAVADLARQGRLTDVRGVGEKTAAIARAALAGEVPGELARLEALPAPDPGPGRALLTALRGDCHSHSDWSDGGSPIEAMATAAAALGHEYLVLTDHSPRLTVAHGLSPERLARQIDVVEGLRAELSPFRLLTGIEVDILDDGSLDQDDGLLRRLDVIVASVHSKLRMDAATMTRRLVTALRNPLVDVLGHCTGRILVGRGRPESTFDAGQVFETAAGLGKAVEVNSRPERLDPPRRLLRQALEAGCPVAIDTDAHAPGQLAWQAYGCSRAAECGASPPSIVNTWPAARLRDWVQSHRDS